MTEQAKRKLKFRTTSKWKSFRKYMKKKRSKDELTGSPLTKRWQLHHHDMKLENYDHLDEANFSCLNPMSHDTVHFFFAMRDWRTALKNLERILENMERLK